jgi:biopolymer transport protein ExbB/TolQ
MSNLVDFLKENFFHVAPILVAGGFGIVIVIERSLALIWTYPLNNSGRFFDKIRDFVMADQLVEALTYCEEFRNKPVAQVAKEALLRANRPESLIEDGLQLAVSEASEKVTNRTPYLATIANVSTLLGLLGTIVGLIRSFDAIGSASAQQRSALLAAGISTAMNATMLGLGVAIPSMIAFAVLINRTNRLNNAIDQAAVRMLDILKQRIYDVAPTRPSVKFPNKTSNRTSG